MRLQEMTTKEEKELINTIISQTKRINDLEIKLEQLWNIVLDHKQNTKHVFQQLAVGKAIYMEQLSC